MMHLGYASHNTRTGRLCTNVTSLPSFYRSFHWRRLVKYFFVETKILGEQEIDVSSLTLSRAILYVTLSHHERFGMLRFQAFPRQMVA